MFGRPKAGYSPTGPRSLHAASKPPDVVPSASYRSILMIFTSELGVNELYDLRTRITCRTLCAEVRVKSPQGQSAARLTIVRTAVVLIQQYPLSP